MLFSYGQTTLNPIAPESYLCQTSGCNWLVPKPGGICGKCRSNQLPGATSYPRERYKGKPRFSLLPADALQLVASVVTGGADKHGEGDWESGAETVTSHLDAMHRHLLAHQAGETKDTDSGLPHLAHACSRCLMALALHVRGGK